MPVNINEALLLERQFEKVYKVDYNGKYHVYYYKQGMYLKFLCEHYCAVYNNEMRFMGTIKNFYPLGTLSAAKTYPLNMN